MFRSPRLYNKNEDIEIENTSANEIYNSVDSGKSSILKLQNNAKKSATNSNDAEAPEFSNGTDMGQQSSIHLSNKEHPYSRDTSYLTR